MSSENKNNEIKKTNQNKKDDYKIKYLNALADMENLRKRLDNERVDLIKFRASSFIQEILPTIDMFELALCSKNVKPEIKN
jgi:molecular chaperone GrpE